jgi:energy-coupling factor transporter ATP-binding protein EcfA2
VSGVIFQRSDGIVWRALSDRVFVHRVGASPDLAAAELSGPVAVIWLALDEPATVPEIRRRLAEASVTVAEPEAELDRLVSAGLVEAIDPGPGDEPPALVGRLAVYDTTVLVSASPPLDAELRSSFVDLLIDADDEPTAELRDHRLDVELAGDVWTVRWNGVASYVGPSIDLALYDSLIVLNHHAAATATASGRTVLHGGAVDTAGRAIVVVGHSGSGKSTMTAALTRAGHAYLADEVVAIDDDLIVHGFHRPIGLRSGGLTALGLVIPTGPYGSVSPHRGGPELGARCPLGLVVILRRSNDPTAAVLRDLSPPAALLELANQTLGASGHERAMFRRLDAFVRRARIAELSYSDLADAVTTLEQAATEPTADASTR